MSTLKYIRYPQVLLELAKEIVHHPKLFEILYGVKVDDTERLISETAAYCGIIVDGYYSQEEIEKMYVVLLKELQGKRIAPNIIVPGNISIH